MKTTTILPPFALSAHPADILEGAHSVTRFLAEMSPYMTSDKDGAGLSEKGAYGLQLILDALDKNIEAAAAAL